MTETTTTEPALDAHVRDYIESKGFNPNRLGNWDTSNGIGLAADAVASGWHAARADLAETLRDLVEGARAEVAKRHPFPILPRLDALVRELEDGLGR